MSFTIPSGFSSESIITGGRKLRAGTSRFLGPCSFILYKFLASIYGLFWCVWWPMYDEIETYLPLNFWTFYVGTACEFRGTFEACVQC